MPSREQIVEGERQHVRGARRLHARRIPALGEEHNLSIRLNPGQQADATLKPLEDIEIHQRWRRSSSRVRLRNMVAGSYA